MTSTTSSNQTVRAKGRLKDIYAMLVWNLKSCSGMLTVYSILSAVFTFTILILCMSLGQYAVSEKIQLFQIIAASLIELLTIIFTVCYTIKNYSYMHNKRKADFYGSMPISRSVQFIANTISAYLFSVLPAMFFMGIISLISVFTGTLVVSEVTQMYVQMIIGTLACVCFYGLIAVCCGTTMNSVIMFIVVCIAYPIAVLIVKAMINGFFLGIYADAIDKSFLKNALNPLAAYGGENIIYWIIFSAACVFVSILLIRKRKSERAQTSFAFYLPCYLIKFLVAFIFGMLLGIVFAGTNVFGSSLFGFVSGYLVGSAAAYIIAHLIFYKGFSKLLKSLIPFAVLAVAVIGGTLILGIDPFGYSSYVPNVSEVESAGLIDSTDYFSNNGSSLYEACGSSAEDFTDDEMIEEIISIHTDIVEKGGYKIEDKFKRVWSGGIGAMLSGLTGESDVYTIAYKLSDGSVVTRYYPCEYLTVSNHYLKDNSSDYYNYYYDEYGIGVLDYYLTDYISEYCENITASKTYVLKYTALANASAAEFYDLGYTGIESDGGFGYGDIWNTGGTASPSSEQLLIKKISEAYLKDLEADEENYKAALYPRYSDSDDGLVFYEGELDENDSESRVIFEISLFAEYYDENNNYSSSSEIYNVPATYTNTLNVLISEGILNPDCTVNMGSEYYEYIYY